MNIISTQIYKSPCGELILGDYKGQICLCDWNNREKRNAIDARLKKGLMAEYKEHETEILWKAKKQLDQYFSGERKKFDLPVVLVGTEFQKTVWKALETIPYGKTASYAELAEKIKNPKAIRALGTANGANSISVIIPCHRVIGKNGSMTGYAGGLAVKQYLLNLEQE